MDRCTPDQFRKYGKFFIAAALSLPSLVFITKPAAAQGAPGELINNPGFEGAYTPVPVVSGAAITTGVIADRWLDESSGSSLNVKYSEERENVHGGRSAQRVELSNVQTGSVCFGQQLPALSSKRQYTVALWERGDGKVKVALGVRASSDTNGSFGQVEQTTSANSWQRLTVTITPTQSGSAFLYVLVDGSGSVCVDDASLIESSATK